VTPIPKPRGDTAEVAREVIEHLLQLLGVAGTIEPQALPIAAEEKEAAPAVALNIRGEDLGILIGRRGQTLAALQYIVRLLVGRQVKTWVPIVIDVEGYKQRRYQALESFARQMAERVKAKGAPFTLEPMPAYERRIVHLALANHPDVITESIGQGESRKVVIRPRKK
jgi:spoIIIJ-associated protein